MRVNEQLLQVFEINPFEDNLTLEAVMAIIASPCSTSNRVELSEINLGFEHISYGLIQAIDESTLVKKLQEEFEGDPRFPKRARLLGGKWGSSKRTPRSRHTFLRKS